MEPLLKWPGGKRKLAAQIIERFPRIFGTYFEPFLGGGAVFFALEPRRAVLSDHNQLLIGAYERVKRAPGRVAARLRKWPNNEESFYRVRALSPRDRDAQAARIIFLCTLSFNGIYRENLSGAYNVPYGHKTHLDPADGTRIDAASRTLRGASLLAADFEDAVSSAGRGDLVYFDPPYTVAHSSNGFVKYNARIFSWEDQQRLARCARGLADRGCGVFVSNADHDSIRALYRGFQARTLERHSVIAASGRFRGRVTECLFYSG